jgi:hypothetical protein
MAEEKDSRKDTFKQIFLDGWESFKAKYPRYESADEVVQKMLGCGKYENGYAVYKCPECMREKIVPFSCKSSFCLSCAKTYTMNWVERVREMLHEGVEYRHLVLTIPEELRVWYYRHPDKMYAGMMKIGSEMMDDAVSTAKGRELELGYIVVLQTSGRAANYNPHLHIIMTDGGLDKEGQWHKLGYMPYDVLHKKWEYYLFKMVKEVLTDEPRVRKLIDELWQRYPRGLVAHLQEKAVPKVDGLARYIAKYVVSPPIALSRIIEYDRERGTVKYWYRDHRTGGKQVEELSREQFIGRMVQHILPKGFKRIRYYGLQAICKVKKVAAILKRAVKRVVQGVLDFVNKVSEKLSYRERMKRAYGKDPLKCEHCGREMWLWRIWHPDYGIIYDELERIEQGKYDSRNVGSARMNDKGEDVIQLPLFRLPPVYA